MKKDNQVKDAMEITNYYALRYALKHFNVPSSALTVMNAPLNTGTRN